MMRQASLAFTIVLPLLFVPSCLRDFQQFEASDEGSTAGDGDGDLGGSSGDGDLVGDGDGDLLGDGDGDLLGDGDGDTGTGGAAGGAPNVSCRASEKLCDDECIPNNQPQTGCNQASCEACPSVPHAPSFCSAGDCAVGSCDSGFVDCDDAVENGCEHSRSTFSELACGGCDADCTTLGLSNCQSDLCGCAQDDECGDTKRNVVCQARVCACDDVACNPGETCGRMGNTSFCECGGRSACESGWVCCPGGSGASCKQLQGSDASNCGACGFRCADGQVCLDGTCQ